MTPVRLLHPILMVIACTILPLLPMAPGAQARDPGPAADLIAAPPFSISATRLSPALAARAEGRLLDFSRATGTHWQATNWAPASLAPGLATGSGLDLGVSIHDAATAESVARRFVVTHSELFQTSETRLGEPLVRSGLGKWSVQWPEEVDGLRILQSRVQVLLTESGRLAAFGATTYPSITNAVPAVLTGAQAQSIAREYLTAQGLVPLPAAVEGETVQGTYVLPWLGSGAGPAGGLAAPVEVTGRTVIRVTITSHEPPAGYDVDVDAATGEVLQRTSRAWNTPFSGTVAATLDDTTLCFGQSDYATSHLRVTVTQAGSAVTGPDGSFVIPFAGSQPRTLTATFQGPYAHVFNDAGPESQFSAPIQPGVPFALHWNDSNSLIEERDAFSFTNQVHDWFKGIDSLWTDMDFPLTVVVNGSDQCNAFWVDSTITLLDEGAQCRDASRFLDTVAHEFGHGVTEYFYGTFTLPATDVNEGNSDVAASFLINNPRLAVGFFGDCAVGIRTADNDLRWGVDNNGDPHHDGQIISGFNWDIHQGLIAERGYEQGAKAAASLWHFARSLGLPMIQPDQVSWTFLLDDDDGNLDNGTPDYDLLSQAATHHGFSVPERFEDVVIHDAPLTCGASPHGEPIAIEATIYSLAGALNPDSLRVFYRAAGEAVFHNVPLAPAGGADQYRAMIPGNFAVGSAVEYSLLAVDAAGNRLERPASGVYRFVVGFACDDFEGATTGWTLTQGSSPCEWVRIDPVGLFNYVCGLVSPEDDTTPEPGHLAFMSGEGAYDACHPTTIQSPVFDLTGMSWAVLRYQRFFQTCTDSALGVWTTQVTYDGGASWVVLERLEHVQENPGWNPVAIELHPPGGAFGAVRFRISVTGPPTGRSRRVGSMTSCSWREPTKSRRYRRSRPRQRIRSGWSSG